jgi:hypothetical protein
MKPVSRRLAAAFVSTAAMIILSGSLPAIAQEATNARAQTKATKAARRPYDPTRRVPPYFGQLGLTDAQKESIYGVRAKHQPKIDALEKQLDDLREQMLKDCETVLTDAQKKLLEERRTGATESRARRVGGAGAGAAAKPQG